jgi:molybdopterin/thiamine biosynthesis adenylyltransferase
MVEVGLPDERHEAAVNQVQTVIINPLQSARRLTDGELATHGTQFKTGWELPALLDSEQHRLRLLLPDRFPFARPRIAINPIERVLTWPHLEEKGLLCLVPEEAPYSPENPVATVIDVLSRARTLVNDSLEGRGLEHFEDEFVSYWNRWAEMKKVVRSLCRPEGPSRWARVWYGEAMTVIAEDDSRLREWLDGFTGGKITNKNINPQRIPFIWLATVPRPIQYPNTVEEMFKLVVGDVPSISLIEELLLDDSIKNKHVLFGCSSSRGVGLGAVRIQNPSTPKSGGNPLTRGGFRGPIPRYVLLPRYMSARIIGASVVRSDPAWVHGRDHNLDVNTLAKKTVVVFGVGSVGSPIITMLAQAGVGKITLVDPQTLDSENTGRHELGADSVDRNKAIQMAISLRQRFPHLTIQSHGKTWQQVADENLDLLLSADLIISTMGSWSLESNLNAFALAQPKFPPILYGWTEAHAAAGHAVVFLDRAACFRCLTDDIGQMRFAVTAWADMTTKQIPACGGSFQPYGTIELAHINSMISELALDVLTGRQQTSFHRVWIGRRT